MAFGRKLEAAGVPLELQTYPGFIHGFLGFSEQVPEVAGAFDAIGRALASGLDMEEPDTVHGTVLVRQ
jgi:acetyl esterase/lipase